MAAPDMDVISFVKDWVWAPVMGLVAWAWNRNEREHEMLREANAKTREDASTSHSHLMDRIVTFVKEEDAKITDEQAIQRKHIEKLFDKIEQHAQRSEDRHNELMKALHEGLSMKADRRELRD